MTSLGMLKRRLYLIVARYFRWWATLSLRRWKPRIIAVTGSVGKTTMLHLIEAQLGERAHYSHHANSAFGIAFDIVGVRGITGSKLRWLWLFLAVPLKSLVFRHSAEFYVVEVDGERPDEVGFVASWLQPEVTLWISLGNSHAIYFDQQVANGLFDDVETAIAHEFGRLAAHTSGYVIANSGEPLIRAQLESLGARVSFVSIDTLTHYKVWPERSEFGFGEQTVYRFSYPLPRETGMQLGILDALMKYLSYDIDYEMKSFVMPPGRSSYFAGINSTKLIDSSYNAHLISMRSMIDMYDSMEIDQKWLVLGDMIEQGKSEQREHELLAQRLKSAHVDRIILIGRRLATHTYPLLENETKFTVAQFDNPKQALDYIIQEVQGGETLLFKGSQYLEWLVEKLLRNPEDVQLLARQEPAAKNRREQRGLL